MTPVQQENIPENTRLRNVFLQGMFPVEMTSFMFLSQHRDTQVSFYLLKENFRLSKYHIFKSPAGTSCVQGNSGWECNPDLAHLEHSSSSWATKVVGQSLATSYVIIMVVRDTLRDKKEIKKLSRNTLAWRQRNKTKVNFEGRFKI